MIRRLVQLFILFLVPCLISECVDARSFDTAPLPKSVIANLNRRISVDAIPTALGSPITPMLKAARFNWNNAAAIVLLTAVSPKVAYASTLENIVGHPNLDQIASIALIVLTAIAVAYFFSPGLIHAANEMFLAPFRIAWTILEFIFGIVFIVYLIVQKPIEFLLNLPIWIKRELTMPPPMDLSQVQNFILDQWNQGFMLSVEFDKFYFRRFFLPDRDDFGTYWDAISKDLVGWTKRFNVIWPRFLAVAGYKLATESVSYDEHLNFRIKIRRETYLRVAFRRLLRTLFLNNGGDSGLGPADPSGTRPGTSPNGPISRSQISRHLPSAG